MQSEPLSYDCIQNRHVRKQSEPSVFVKPTGTVQNMQSELLVAIQSTRTGRNKQSLIQLLQRIQLKQVFWTCQCLSDVLLLLYLFSGVIAGKQKPTVVDRSIYGRGKKTHDSDDSDDDDE